MPLDPQYIYLPLDQGERAGRLTVNQLLARSVYEKMAQMLKEALPDDTQDQNHDATRYANGRGHMTIFLDGNRGTGKTTVIVNLIKYLEAVEQAYPGLADPGVADAVHILKPIDPSQLEDGDDLFLNVVVAAVLGDAAVKAQREREPELWQALHDSLQALGTALSGRESQGEGIGLDRLRAFMGSQALAGAVHDFFSKAARLLGKKLLVLPIDDVDTTLHRAFENLEVVRRYLASPALLPIVCGDLALYREVTSRDTYRRLTLGSEQFKNNAQGMAEDLAMEYLRKILPLHRRMRMPDVSEYLQSYRILLGGEDREPGRPWLTLKHLAHWLKVLLAGSVNNSENSALEIPIPTVRALSQLLARVRSEIASLENAFIGYDTPIPEINMMWRLCELDLGRQSRMTAGMLYRPWHESTSLFLDKWCSELLSHFSFESSAGPVCLVLIAMQHWAKGEGSVLATPLFQPLEQVGLTELRYTESRAQLAWQDDLRGRLPESWLRSLQTEAVVPFATPEVGRAVVPANWKAGSENDAGVWNLLVEMVTHHNFYSTSKRATLLCCGRIIELVVTSLVREVTQDDVYRICANPPYHSAVSVAATKAVHYSLDDIEYEEMGQEDEPTPYSQYAGANDGARRLAIEQLVNALNEWRFKSKVQAASRSPWLIYCALNKTYNQLPMFNRPLAVNAQPKAELLSDVVASGLSAFNAFWAAIASFEKGPLFGMGVDISTVNLLNRRGDFSQNNLFTQNIQPFLSKVEDAQQERPVVALTTLLESHPLRQLYQSFFKIAQQRELDEPSTVAMAGRAYLLKALGMPPTTERLSSASIKRALQRGASKKQLRPKRYGEAVLADVQQRYPDLKQLNLLRRAIESLELGRTPKEQG